MSGSPPGVVVRPGQYRFGRINPFEDQTVKAKNWIFLDAVTGATPG